MALAKRLDFNLNLEEREDEKKLEEEEIFLSAPGSPLQIPQKSNSPLKPLPGKTKVTPRRS